MNHDAFPTTLAERQLRAMLDVLDEARHTERPMATLTHGLARLVPSDAVCFSELDLPTRRILVQHVNVAGGDEDAGDDEDACEAYFRLRYQHPVCVRHERHGAAVGVLQLADFLTTRQLHELPLYHQHLAPAEHIMALPLPTAPGRTRVFQFFRNDHRTPFSERDRMTLTLLQPHVYDIYRQAAERRGTVRLTTRELDVMRCVAQGMDNARIARQLVVSPSTVRKHLENIFHRLGVHNRTAAIARVFPDSAPR